MTVIIDYRAGNLTSVRLAFEALGTEACITNDAQAIRKADRIVFPGVGAAGTAMQNLRRLGLVDIIRDVAADGVPFLGICLGTQIILDHSAEDGGVDGLGIIPGRVELFRPQDPFEKVPQMGWNGVTFRRHHPVLAGIRDGSEFYFVHSYFPAPREPAAVVGETAYGGTVFASVIGRENVIATQFHPEKSGRIGLELLKNFCEWTP